MIEDRVRSCVVGQGVKKGQVLSLNGKCGAGGKPSAGEQGLTLLGRAAQDTRRPSHYYAKPQPSHLAGLFDGRVDEAAVVEQAQDAVPLEVGAVPRGGSDVGRDV